MNNEISIEIDEDAANLVQTEDAHMLQFVPYAIDKKVVKIYIDSLDPIRLEHIQSLIRSSHYADSIVLPQLLDSKNVKYALRSLYPKPDPQFIPLIRGDLAREHLVVPCTLDNGDMYIYATSTDIPYPVREQFIRQSIEKINVITISREKISHLVDLYYPVINQNTNTDTALGAFTKIITNGIDLQAEDITFEDRGDIGIVYAEIDNHARDISGSRQMNIEDIQNMIRAALSATNDPNALDLTQPHGRSLTIPHHNQSYRIRITVVPTSEGKGMMSVRIFKPEAIYISLDKIIPDAKERAKIESASRKNSGLFIISGPPGSGKSTLAKALLYGIAKVQKRPLLRAIEDPIESRTSWMTQYEITTSDEYASRIRSFLRMPTSGLLLAEINDHVTTFEAIRAALARIPTYATTHGDDAPSTIHRLLVEGASPLNLSQVLRMVIGQRLLGRLCDRCAAPASKEDRESAKEQFEAYGLDTDTSKMCEPVGCKECIGGFIGRISIHEILNVNGDTRKAIAEQKDSLYIAQTDPEYIPLNKKIFLAVAKGETSYNEGILWGAWNK